MNGWTLEPLDPGADVERISHLAADAHGLLDQAVQEHVHEADRSLAGVVVLFSGGNDSTTLAHLFKDRATHAAHANTGIGIEQTRQYVRDTCAEWSLPLIEEHPRIGETYRDLVLGRVRVKAGPSAGKTPYPGGSPGPAMHFVMYQRLKERSLERVRRQLVENPYQQRVIFLAGRRAEPVFPAKPVRDEQKAALLRCISEIADGHERVLQTGRDHRQVFSVLGAQFERRAFVRRHPAASRSGHCTPRAFPRAARNRDPGDRRD